MKWLLLAMFFLATPAYAYYICPTAPTPVQCDPYSAACVSAMQEFNSSYTTYFNCTLQTPLSNQKDGTCVPPNPLACKITSTGDACSQEFNQFGSQYATYYQCVNQTSLNATCTAAVTGTGHGSYTWETGGNCQLMCDSDSYPNTTGGCTLKVKPVPVVAPATQTSAATSTPPLAIPTISVPPQVIPAVKNAAGKIAPKSAVTEPANTLAPAATSTTSPEVPALPEPKPASQSWWQKILSWFSWL